jgi:RHS repeat-associated protein
MPTAKGYTGQRADAASGLDYYGARYYDPATDQFVTADTAAAGLNRYAYVAGNPETATDPTGHRMSLEGEPGCGGSDGGGGGTGSGGGSGGVGTGGGGGSGSGSGGGGGSGGTGNGTGQGGKCGGTRDCLTPPSAHGGGSKCVGACAARKAASDAAAVFNVLKIFFEILGLGGTIAAAYYAVQAAEDALGALAAPELAEIDAVVEAANLVAIGNAAVVMAVAAALAWEFDRLDTVFTDESQHGDGWWTDANINQFNLTQVLPVIAGANAAGAAMIQLGGKLPLAGQSLIIGGYVVLAGTVAATVESSDAMGQEYMAIDPPPAGPVVGPR